MNETPGVYRTVHFVTGRVPVWCHVGISGGHAPGDLPRASGYEPEDVVDDVDAELTCNCGDTFDRQRGALDHLRDHAGEVLTVKEGPDGDVEVLDRERPEVADV